MVGLGIAALIFLVGLGVAGYYLCKKLSGE